MTSKNKNRGKERYIQNLLSKTNNEKCSQKNKDQIYKTIRKLGRN